MAAGTPLGKRLRAARLAAGIATLREAEDRTGVSARSIRGAEHGEYEPRLGTIKKLAKGYRRSWMGLLTGREA